MIVKFTDHMIKDKWSYQIEFNVKNMRKILEWIDTKTDNYSVVGSSVLFNDLQDVFESRIQFDFLIKNIKIYKKNFSLSNVKTSDNV